MSENGKRNVKFMELTLICGCSGLAHDLSIPYCFELANQGHAAAEGSDVVSRCVHVCVAVSMKVWEQVEVEQV
jgi:hypothetical protein